MDAKLADPKVRKEKISHILKLEKQFDQLEKNFNTDTFQNKHKLIPEMLEAVKKIIKLVSQVYVKGDDFYYLVPLYNARIHEAFFKITCIFDEELAENDEEAYFDKAIQYASIALDEIQNFVKNRSGLQQCWNDVWITAPALRKEIEAMPIEKKSERFSVMQKYIGLLRKYENSNSSKTPPKRIEFLLRLGLQIRSNLIVLHAKRGNYELCFEMLKQAIDILRRSLDFRKALKMDIDDPMDGNSVYPMTTTLDTLMSHYIKVGNFKKCGNCYEMLAWIQGQLVSPLVKVNIITQLEYKTRTKILCPRVMEHANNLVLAHQYNLAIKIYSDYEDFIFRARKITDRQYENDTRLLNTIVGRKNAAIMVQEFSQRPPALTSQEMCAYALEQAVQYLKEQKKLDETIAAFQQLRCMAELVEEINYLAISYFALTACYLARGELVNAKIFIVGAIDNAIQLDDHYLLMHAYSLKVRLLKAVMNSEHSDSELEIELGLADSLERFTINSVKFKERGLLKELCDVIDAGSDRIDSARFTVPQNMTTKEYLDRLIKQFRLLQKNYESNKSTRPYLLSALMKFAQLLIGISKTLYEDENGDFFNIVLYHAALFEFHFTYANEYKELNSLEQRKAYEVVDKWAKQTQKKFTEYFDKYSEYKKCFSSKQKMKRELANSTDIIFTLHIKFLVNQSIVYYKLNQLPECQKVSNKAAGLFLQMNHFCKVQKRELKSEIYNIVAAKLIKVIVDIAALKESNVQSLLECYEQLKIMRDFLLLLDPASCLAIAKVFRGHLHLLVKFNQEGTVYTIGMEVLDFYKKCRGIYKMESSFYDGLITEVENLVKPIADKRAQNSQAVLFRIIKTEREKKKHKQKEVVKQTECNEQEETPDSEQDIIETNGTAYKEQLQLLVPPETQEDIGNENGWVLAGGGKRKQKNMPNRDGSRKEVCRSGKEKAPVNTSEFIFNPKAMPYQFTGCFDNKSKTRFQQMSFFSTETDPVFVQLDRLEKMGGTVMSDRSVYFYPPVDKNDFSRLLEIGGEPTSDGGMYFKPLVHHPDTASVASASCDHS